MSHFWFIFLDCFKVDHISLASFTNAIDIFGSGALPVKMLLVRIVENNRNDAYFRAG